MVGAVRIARNGAFVAAEILSNPEIRAIQIGIIRPELGQGDGASLVRNTFTGVSFDDLFGVGAICPGKHHASTGDAGCEEKRGE